MKKLIILVLFFLAYLSVFATFPTNEDIVVRSVFITGPGPNNWLLLSNGAIWLPPFTFPSEDGGDAQRGGIYFGSPGYPSPMNNNNNYFLNLVHRGDNGGQLLISHASIDIEEQNFGEIVLGNDGSVAGIIRVRYNDSFGDTLGTNGGVGHTHPIIFQARKKYPDGGLHNAFPAIIAFHGGGSDVFYGNDSRYGGPSARGELAFYTGAPYTGWQSELIRGEEMGRMETNGWNLRGSETRERVYLTNSSTNYVIDFSKPYFTDIQLTTTSNYLSSVGWRPGDTNVQHAVVILRAGTTSKVFSFPKEWVMFYNNLNKMQNVIPGNCFLRIDLECVGVGESNVYASFQFGSRR